MMTRDLTLLTDLYQLTMMQGYYQHKMEKRVVFDLYYRRNPSGNGYAICAGLEQAIDYLNNLKFKPDDIEYLRSLEMFSEDFLEYLSTFRFTGDIEAIPEGTVVFPGEPLMRVCAPILEAQYIETALLNIINHQSLIATKAARVVQAANGDPVLEFGLRRAQGPDAGTYGARATIIAGCAATSNVLAGKLFNVPISGTQAHSWIMSFEHELEAFRAYASVFPDNCILLVDTYDTVKSGVPNAIKVFDEMKASGKKLNKYGIRLDSGDLAYMSKKARKLLDAAGHEKALISASSDLDEYLIADLKRQGAQITLWGVGTKLITSSDCSAFGGIYKLSAEEDKNGQFQPKIKLSDNPEKVTTPGIKKLIRFYDKETGKIKADLIALQEESFDFNQELIIFDDKSTWKKMKLQPGTYEARSLLVPVYINGECVYNRPSVMEIQAYCEKERDTLWGEHTRLINPARIPVGLSLELYNLKQDMINDHQVGL